MSEFRLGSALGYDLERRRDASQAAILGPSRGEALWAMSGPSTTDHALAFAILGPLRVTNGGTVVALGGRQQRAILARLLVAGSTAGCQTRAARGHAVGRHDRRTASPPRFRPTSSISARHSNRSGGVALPGGYWSPRTGGTGSCSRPMQWTPRSSSRRWTRVSGCWPAGDVSRCRRRAAPRTRTVARRGSGRPRRLRVRGTGRGAADRAAARRDRGADRL